MLEIIFGHIGNLQYLECYNSVVIFQITNPRHAGIGYPVTITWTRGPSWNFLPSPNGPSDGFSEVDFRGPKTFLTNHFWTPILFIFLDNIFLPKTLQDNFLCFHKNCFRTKSLWFLNFWGNKILWIQFFFGLIPFPFFLELFTLLFLGQMIFSGFFFLVQNISSIHVFWSHIILPIYLRPKLLNQQFKIHQKNSETNHLEPKIFETTFFWSQILYHYNIYDNKILKLIYIWTKIFFNTQYFSSTHIFR